MLQVNIDRISYVAAIVALREGMGPVKAFDPNLGVTEPLEVSVHNPVSSACLRVYHDNERPSALVAADIPEEEGHYFVFEDERIDQKWVEDMGTSNFDLIQISDEWELDTLEQREVKALLQHVESEFRRLKVPGVILTMTRNNDQGFLVEGVQTDGRQVNRDDDGFCARIFDTARNHANRRASGLAGLLAMLAGRQEEDEPENEPQDEPAKG